MRAAGNATWAQNHVIRRIRRLRLPRSDLASWLTGLLFALTVNGALPFLVTPTTGQAMWAMGFAESLANAEWWSVRAHDIGVPHPAPIAFGLAGAWPAGALLRFGIPTSDAYTLVVAGWLTVAYWAAFRIARLLGHTSLFSVLAAASWLCMPMIWAHAHFGQLALGLALLPLYFFPVLLLIVDPRIGPRGRLRRVATCFAVAIIAAFMDGYSFVMMAVGTGLVLVYGAVFDRERRSAILRFALPTQAASLAIAYVLYSMYIGKSEFEPHSLDAFRAFAIDLTFLAQPTEGMHWLADLTRLSAHRGFEHFYGDPTVYMTTFALPVLILSSVAGWLNRRTTLSASIALVALFGLYMSAGPTLKANTTRADGTLYNAMPADAGILPTGNELLTEALPGFDVMRASYRWLALCLFAGWLLVILYSATAGSRRKVTWALALAAITALNLPDLPAKLELESGYRDSIARIDQEWLPDARSRIVQGETAAFLPLGNDFLANYLAPRAGFRTLNIGGDKNLQMAMANWPAEMTAAAGRMTAQKAPQVEALLRSGEVTVVILPHFDLIMAANEWPCGGVKLLDTDRRQALPKYVGRTCLAERRADVSPLLTVLARNPALIVDESSLFATVRLR